MPSKLKKRTRIRKNELDPFEVEHLMKGDSTLPIYLTDQQIKTLWQRHKQYIMSYYTDGYQYTGEDNTLHIVLRHTKPGPGKRPWAWWKWESKEPLRVNEEPCTNYPAICGACELRYYKDQYLLANYCRRTEKEVDYLIRLNLLTDTEKRLLNL